MANEIKVDITVNSSQAEAAVKKFAKAAVKFSKVVVKSSSQAEAAVKKFAKAAAKSSSSITKSNKVSEAAVKKFAKAAAKSSSSITKSNNSIAKSSKKASSAIKKASKKITKGVSTMERAFASFAGNLASTAISGAFTAFKNIAISAITSSIEKAKELEQIRTQFEILTGSVAQANKTLKDLQTFAATTPFQLPGIAKAAAQLISFGFEANTIVDRLKRIGDVAAGSKSDLKEIALIYGQVSAAGKLTGERLLQFQERAIPIGPALAKTMKVAEKSIKGMVSRGEVDFATFEKAFNSLSSESGLFFEGMIKQSKTLGGVLSTLSDNVGLVQADIGDEFLPVIKSVSIELIKLIQQNQKLIKSFATEASKKFAEALDFTIGAIIKLDMAFQFVRIAGNEFESAINSYLQVFVDLTTTALQAAKAVATFLRQDTSSIDRMIESTKLLSSVFDESKQALTKSNNEIIQSFVDRENAANSFREAIRSGTEEEIALNQSKNDAILESDKDRNKKQGEIAKEKSEKIKALEEENAVAAEEVRLLTTEKDKLEADEDFAFLQERLGTEAALREVARIQGQKNTEKSIQLRLKARKKGLDAEAAQEAKRAEFTKLTFKEQVNAAATTADNLVALSKAAGKEQGTFGKAVAISQAIIQGILGVQFALGSAPPPLNFVNAAIVGATAALNVNKIRSTPAFAGGGIVGGNQFSGDNVNARVNSGEMILNRRQQTSLFDAINAGTGGSGININIEAGVGGISDGQIDDLIDAINDRTEFGNAILGAA